MYHVRVVVRQIHCKRLRSVRHDRLSPKRDGHRDINQLSLSWMSHLSIQPLVKRYTMPWLMKAEPDSRIVKGKDVKVCHK